MSEKSYLLTIGVGGVDGGGEVDVNNRGEVRLADKSTLPNSTQPNPTEPNLALT